MRLRTRARVGVNREEQVVASAICVGGPSYEPDELVGAPRQNHVDARRLLAQLFEPQRHVAHQLRFDDAAASRARIVAAMAGIDDDPRDAEPELSGDGKLAGA